MCVRYLQSWLTFETTSYCYQKKSVPYTFPHVDFYCADSVSPERNEYWCSYDQMRFSREASNGKIPISSPVLCFFQIFMSLFYVSYFGQPKKWQFNASRLEQSSDPFFYAFQSDIIIINTSTRICSNVLYAIDTG
jgi:hypothetical protein